jgi:hypothetical protein
LSGVEAVLSAVYKKNPKQLELKAEKSPNQVDLQ